MTRLLTFAIVSTFFVRRTQTEMPFGAEDFSGLIKVRLAPAVSSRCESPSRRWTVEH
jgi:hypothetical protein